MHPPHQDLASPHWSEMGVVTQFFLAKEMSIFKRPDSDTNCGEANHDRCHRLSNASRAQEANVLQEILKMGHNMSGRRWPLAGEEDGGYLQLAPSTVLPIPLARDGPATT